MNQHLVEPLQKELIKITNKEADIEWARNTITPPTPPFTKVAIKKDSAWWLMFFKGILLEMRM